ncbi:hypothetical protein FRC06_000338 [Ceratobasidium sp. 370]|nr:hypothetical protein FRC06_000338 [Ceratobasidium sp. 370]
MEPRKPYFFYFVTNGRTRGGAPIYNLLKVPFVPTSSVRHTDPIVPAAHTVSAYVMHIASPDKLVSDVASAIGTAARPSLGRSRQRSDAYCDLWSEAYSIKDGCSFVQYVDGPEYHISCLGCGREFAKRYLRQGTLVEIRDVPP